jgi:hypothetical protein
VRAAEGGEAGAQRGEVQARAREGAVRLRNLGVLRRG